MPPHIPAMATSPDAYAFDLYEGLISFDSPVLSDTPAKLPDMASKQKRARLSPGSFMSQVVRKSVELVAQFQGRKVQ